MAARTNSAVVGIDHLTKTGATQVMLRVLNSVAVVAAARAVYILVRDPEDDERRLFLPAENNLGKIRTGLSFRIVERLAPPPVFDAYPAVKWEDGAVTMTADEALATKPDGRKSQGAEAAKLLLFEMLNGKPVLASEVEERAKELQIGKHSVKTAKNALSVVSTRETTGLRRWWWTLPGQEVPL
jgi:putative DNA primase/helicase